jgi:hypothetical protein
MLKPESYFLSFRFQFFKNYSLYSFLPLTTYNYTAKEVVCKSNVSQVQYLLTRNGLYYIFRIFPQLSYVLLG